MNDDIPLDFDGTPLDIQPDTEFVGPPTHTEWAIDQMIYEFWGEPS